MQSNDFIIPGTEFVSRLVQLFQTDGVTAATGLTITDLDLTYCRVGKTPAAKVDATALAAVDSAFGPGKMIEIDGTTMPGVHRVDWADQAFALESWVTNPRHYPRMVALTIKGAAISPKTEIIQLYMPPGLIARYSNANSGDVGSSLGDVNHANTEGVKYAHGAICTLRSHTHPHICQVQHVTGVDPALDGQIFLDKDVNEDEAWAEIGGEIDIIAVPDGYFKGQNPFMLYEGEVALVNSQTSLRLKTSVAGGTHPASPSDDAYNGHLVIVRDNSPFGLDIGAKHGRDPAVRVCTDYAITGGGDIATLTLNRAPHFTVAVGDYIAVLALTGIASETVTHGKAVAGTLSETQMTTDLGEATNGHYNGRLVLWTSGVLRGQARPISGYLGSNKMLTFSKATDAPSAGDAFVIV